MSLKVRSKKIGRALPFQEIEQELTQEPDPVPKGHNFKRFSIEDEDGGIWSVWEGEIVVVDANDYYLDSARDLNELKERWEIV